MSRYDGLIIPRSYSEYINKTDAATLQQALQLSGVLSGTVQNGDIKAVTSDAVNTAINNLNITDTAPSFGFPRGGTYTLNYLRKQTVGKLNIYNGSVKLGTNATGGALYLQVDGIAASNNDIFFSSWYMLGSTKNGILYTSSNTSLWLQNGYTNDTNRLTSSEAAGETIEFFIICFKA